MKASINMICCHEATVGSIARSEQWEWNHVRSGLSFVYIYIYIYILQNGCLHDVRDASLVCESSQFLTAWRLVLSMKPWSYIWLEFGLFSTIIYIYICVYVCTVSKNRSEVYVPFESYGHYRWVRVFIPNLCWFIVNWNLRITLD